MGAASSGGSDNQVSGNEAFYSPPKAKVSTYSSMNIDPKKGKTVNQTIAEQNQKNRDDRRSPITKILSKTPGGILMNKISNSKFVQDQNFKSRFRFAQKSGKFKDTPLTRDFVLSKGFKTQLDGMGYSERNDTEGNDNRDADRNNKTPLQAGIFPGESDPNAPSTPFEPSNAETETDKKYDPRKTKKKGRNQNLLTSARGVMKTSPDYSLGKKSLLGQVV